MALATLCHRLGMVVLPVVLPPTAARFASCSCWYWTCDLCTLHSGLAALVLLSTASNVLRLYLAWLAGLPPPFAAAERAPESPTGSDEASGCAVDLQRLEQQRTGSQPSRCKVLPGWLTLYPTEHANPCRTNACPHMHSGTART